MRRGEKIERGDCKWEKEGEVKNSGEEGKEEEEVGKGWQSRGKEDGLQREEENFLSVSSRWFLLKMWVAY